MKKVVLLAGMFLWLTFDQQAWSQTRTKLNVVYPAVTGVMMGLIRIVYGTSSASG